MDPNDDLLDRVPTVLPESLALLSVPHLGKHVANGEHVAPGQRVAPLLLVEPYP